MTAVDIDDWGEGAVTKRPFALVRAALKWTRAIDRASASRHHEALQLLCEISPYFNTNPQYYLLKGFVEFALADYRPAMDDMSVAIQRIKSATNFNADEKAYLTRYATGIVKSAQSVLHAGDDFGQNPTNEVVDFDLSRVRKHLKQKFPVEDAR